MNKKFIALITALAAVTSVFSAIPASAVSVKPDLGAQTVYDAPFSHFTEDGFMYRQDSSSAPTELYLVGFEKELEGDVVIPDIVRGLPVTEIQAGFDRAGKITSVTVPDTVRDIGAAFRYCEYLESVYLPDSVEEIYEGCFKDCPRLKYLHFSKSVKVIGDNMFAGCTSLESVDNLPESVDYIGANPLLGTAFPEDEYGVKYLYGWACDGEHATEKVVIAEGTKGICDNFTGKENQPAIKEVTLPDSLEYIGNGAFSGMTGLTEIELPDGLRVIGDSAFCGTGLKEVALPESLEVIQDGAFAACTSLVSVKYPEKSCKIDTVNFCTFSGCEALADVELGAAPIKTIGKYAFSECNSLTGIDLPKTLEIIESYAFYASEYLVSVTIPESVYSVGGSAFKLCRGLKDITVENAECTFPPIDLYPTENTMDAPIYTTGGSENLMFRAVVHGKEGSTVQKHAKEYGMPFKVIGSPEDEEPVYYEGKVPEDYVPLYGDANADGFVTIADATAILQYIGNGDVYGLSKRGIINADCYEPGSGVTGMDALAVQRFDARVITSLPELGK